MAQDFDPTTAQPLDAPAFRFDPGTATPAAEPGVISTIKRTGGQMLTTAATAAEDVIGSNAATRAVKETGQRTRNSTS